MYHSEVDIKDTTENIRSASLLDFFSCLQVLYQGFWMDRNERKILPVTKGSLHFELWNV